MNYQSLRSGLLLFGLLALSRHVAAEQIDLEKSISPNGNYHLVADGSHVGGDSDGVITAICVGVQRVGGDDLLAHAGWGYGILSSVPDYAKWEWSTDSRFVAIQTRTTKRTFETTLIHVQGKTGKVLKPDVDFIQEIYQRLKKADGFRSLHVTPVRWQGSEIVLKVELPIFLKETDYYATWLVKLKCSPRGAVVKDIAGPEYLRPWLENEKADEVSTSPP